ncbi:type II toxin-antitoxin system Phd/YefM family antitoxin [Microbacterium protaetiae]|uniref:Type II toxin-antitoxin system Phd/YefM family antitoxin n=1 Tax=Microbacterium protaetiae TaxID=2509458 RepID=A0A4P6EDM5_9MICO|nr:type II toxin-antitoxin system Phd/YefM family antitoxin [Microbacterium protaetiae]QAY59413.1 type II toxin-antitoxin system Phd/YefM family antitoxin [Microbacterium protaetiae]
MKTITVGQLRQNPTEMLADVESGATYRITRHDREVGRVVPPGSGAVLTPPKKPGPARTSRLEQMDVETAESLDALIDEMKSDW